MATDNAEGGSGAWQIGQDVFVSLSAAAAKAFKEAQGSAATPNTDQDRALNIAAAALSRVITIYTLDKQANALVPLSLTLREGRFCAGATEMRDEHGDRVTSLMVKQAELAAALDAIRNAGVSFDLALSEGRSPVK